MVHPPTKSTLANRLQAGPTCRGRRGAQPGNWRMHPSDSWGQVLRLPARRRAPRAREVRMIETRRCAASTRGRAPWRLALLAALALSLFGCAAPAASPAPAAGAPAAPAAAPAASSPGPAAAAPQSITLAITSPTALYWPVYIAQAEG